jgi:hypothetical protein
MSRCKYCDHAHPADQTANPDYCIARLEERITALEAELELKQSIICQDETRMKLLEAELVSAINTIRELEAALAKEEGTSDDFD